MSPEEAATLAIERLTEMGIQVDLQSASARQIRLRVVTGKIEVPLGNDVWAAREGLPAWVQGIPIRYEKEAVTEFRTLWETCEEIARAAKRHLADPANPAWRDRLSTATADAFAVLYDAPRPRRAITVEELVASGLTVKVGTDPSEAAIPWYNRHPRLGEVVKTPTPEEETLDILSDQAFSQSMEKSLQQVEEGESRSSVDVRQCLGIPTNKAKKGRNKR